MRCSLAFVGVLAVALPASIPSWGAVIGGPLLREGLEIVPAYQTGITLDRMASTPGSIHLEARVHATAGEAHGFKEGDWIPYLTIAWSMTREDNPTYKKSGLMYPMVSRDGPHYGGTAEMAGPGLYHLAYIVSPPTSHGMLRQTGKDGVAEWWKPITGRWDFQYSGEEK
jgi:uncharacterized protein involved in high-affinity Fe2+ transport